MRKSLMSNIRDFVDTNVRHRIDKVSNNNCDFFDPDLLLVEGHFDELRRFCVEAEKRVTMVLQSIASNSMGANSIGATNHTNIYHNLSSLAAVASMGGSGSLNHLGSADTINNQHNKCQSPSSLDGDKTSGSESGSRLKVYGFSSEPSASSSQNMLNNGYNNSHNNSNNNHITTNNISTSGKRLSNLKHHHHPDNNKLSQQQQQPRLLLSHEGNTMSCDHQQKLSTLNNFQQQQITNSDNVVLSTNIKKNKKLPIVGFLKFLSKSRHKLKHDSLLAKTLTHCTILQSHLTQLYLDYEQTIECHCLKPLRDIIEIDIPNVIKLRKLFIKSYNDLESLKAKYNVANQKQRNNHQHNQSLSNHFTNATYSIIQSNTQQGNIINKLDQLKREIDDANARFEQARDNYATELYLFVCRETELVNLLIKFYNFQEEYQQQAANAIRESVPTLNRVLDKSPKKLVFGTGLEEHLRCMGRPLSLVIELCIHLLFQSGLQEEGLFRVPGSSVKIKKLKYAINAWFVTLASQGDLSQPNSSSSFSVSSSPDLVVGALNANSQQQHNTTTSYSMTLESGRGAMLAIHNLFKNMASHRLSSPLAEADYELINSENNLLTSSITPINNPHLLQEQLGTTTTTTTNQPIYPLVTSPSIPPPTTIDDFTSVSDHSYHHVDHNQQPIVSYDVHTIAGLLKMYLRELPEPLFTFELYHDWIDATIKTLNDLAKHEENADLEQQQEKLINDNSSTNESNQSKQTFEQNESSLEPIREVIRKLPKANHDNLAHLIKFLSILTSYQDSNKMSASNLSITMAPSLIWAPPQSSNGPTDHQADSQPHAATCDSLYTQQMTTTSNAHTNQQSTHYNDDQQQQHALNMQINSVGMSTSLNALVIENLIKHSDELFPDTGLSFQIPFLNQQQLIHQGHTHQPQQTHNQININIHPSPSSKRSHLNQNQQNQTKKNNTRRDLNSVSPTGLSTASSSSFSSSSNSSSNEMNGGVGSCRNQSSRQDNDVANERQELNPLNTTSQNETINCNHKSVGITAIKTTKPSATTPHKQPPPIPPLPKSVLINRNTPTTGGCGLLKTSSHHSKPPAPAVPSVEKQNNRTKQEKSTPSNNSEPQPISLRGTGSIPLNESDQQANNLNNLSNNSSKLNYHSATTIRPTVPPPSRPERKLVTQQDKGLAIDGGIIKDAVNQCSTTSNDSDGSSLDAVGFMGSSFDEDEYDENDENNHDFQPDGTLKTSTLKAHTNTHTKTIN